MAASFPAISIVVPTFNEAHNVPKLVGLLDKALGKIAWEAIIVDDDSPDGTWRVAKQLAAGDPRVRCIRRVGRRGLAGACIEGVLSSAAPYVAVMDADLQHDESILPDMLAMLEKDEADIVVGSRYVDGQAETTGLSARRAFASRFAARLADFVIGNHVSDPMTGFFAMKREVFEASAERLLPSGFKILLDLLASVERPIRIAEVGYRFRSRQQGQSKFDMRAMMDFLALLLHRWTGGLVPVRFLFFAAVGTVGVGVHLATLRIGIDALQLSCEWSQALATLCAMTSNFAINNLFTYRDMMLRGGAALTGLLRFYAVCSIGVIANVGVASYLFESDRTWWVASLAGIVVGTAFNYTMSSIFIWGRRP
jgi:dolichol-phosphate mannosyltransferase